ncbi:MAG TPA: nucleoside 2-deoxyribosyltransferase [Anaerolineaceae bacterium]|nr:nucleoside 2-deoxyribosyltransferase [Anaerolineaceae bacterium]HOV06381.1 nucleoside 2-deoxyribosyltransferase [Anaerolineaceae bacterium]
MRIYFSCSITGGRAEEATYQAIVRELESEGHEVPTAHLSSPNVMEMEKIVNAVDIFTRDMAWLRECDAVVAEVSSPSHGVGYEIAYGLSLGKPVFCCYRKDRRVSKIITGNTTPGIKVLSYETDAEAVNLVRNYLLSLEKSE